MQPSTFHYFPLAAPFLLAFLLFFALVIISIEVGIIGYAYERIGINRRYVFGLLLLSLLGSYINVPVAELPGEKVMAGREIFYYGMLYIVPSVQQLPGTVIAVNLGGAVVPVLVSLYLTVEHGIYVRAAIAVAVVTAVVHALAQPVEGLGIAVPTFIPPVVAAVTALVLSRQMAAPLAYISGSLGTLIGGDLLNLDKIPGLGAPVASIGGAGTFDGIFLTSIAAVLLASPWIGKSSESMQKGDQYKPES